MLVVAGTLHIVADKVEEAKALAAIVVEETEKEDGCLFYRFHQDVSKPTQFFVFEQWESEAALDAHLQTPHVRAFANAMTPLRAAPGDVKRYLIEAIKPL